MRGNRVVRLWLLTILFAALVAAAQVPVPPRRKAAQAPPAPDDRIFVNGQPTFTIGYTIGPPLGAKTPDGRNALAELKKQGTIWQRVDGGRWNPEREARVDKILQESAEQGTYAAISISDLQAIRADDTAKIAELKRVVEKYRNHPALLFWKGRDEPEWGGVPAEDLRIYYETIHSLDPKHPVWITQAPRGTADDLRPYDPFYDIGAIDIYPVSYPPGSHSGIPNKNLSVVGDYTQIIRRVTDIRKPIMMVLQICWSDVINPGRTLRMPTFAEERYMAYQAIINGARGLVFFGGNLRGCLNEEDAALGWNWSFYEKVLRPVLEELRPGGPLYPALIAPNSTLPIRHPYALTKRVEGTANLEFAVRETGQYIYILAAAREGPTLLGEFSGLPEGIDSGEVLFEKPRTVKVTMGSFTDWFGPNEVHVYRFQKR
jgi:hypothetical protein